MVAILLCATYGAGRQEMTRQQGQLKQVSTNTNCPKPAGALSPFVMFFRQARALNHMIITRMSHDNQIFRIGILATQ